MTCRRKGDACARERAAEAGAQRPPDLIKARDHHWQRSRRSSSSPMARRRRYVLSDARASRDARIWGAVVREDKIPWPTRGPNVSQTIGSTMRSGANRRTKGPANEQVRRRSSSGVAMPDSACHAGGRGFESRRSRLSKCLQTRGLCCLFRCDSASFVARSWPKVHRLKCLQIRHFLAHHRDRPHKLSRSRR